MLLMPYGLTHTLTTLKDRATQLLKKYKSGALVTQYTVFNDYPVLHGIAWYCMDIALVAQKVLTKTGVI